MKKFVIGFALAALMAVPARAEQYVEIRVRAQGHSRGISTLPVAINDGGAIIGYVRLP